MSKNTTLEKEAEALRNMLAIQKGSLIDEYMIGLYNGLELALAGIECREPEFATKDDIREEVNAEKGEEVKDA